MTAIDTPIVQSIQQAIAIIRQGRELERLLLDAGFALPEAEHPAASNGEVFAPNADDQPSAPEWPQADHETGELIDARGIGWDSRIHSSNKACISDGTWRRRKGADPALVTRLEREAMERIAEDELPATESRDGIATDPHPTIEGEPEPEGEPSDFEKILAGIRTAASEDEVLDWLAESQTIPIGPSKKLALEAARDERRRQLSAQAAGVSTPLRMRDGTPSRPHALAT